MKALLLTIGALAATFSLAIGLSSASAANSSTATGIKVAVAGTGLGKVLVDGRGHTLYLFAKDSRGKSSCTGKCAGFWPPLIATGKPRAAAGAKAALLGTSEAPRRATAGHLQPPSALHLRQGHEAKGQTNGEELDAFGAEWYAVTTGGAKVEKADAASSDGGGYSPGGGYGTGY